ncbi:MAG: arylesterase [Moraxellaceae bacterium]|nr:arylesterase [Moraxellaceae bacterium]
MKYRWLQCMKKMVASVIGALVIFTVMVPAQAATILVFGDSISAAYGLEANAGWVSLLQQKLDKTAAKKHRVFNGSLSGETTSGGVQRLPALLKQHRPDIVILELGGNDGLRGQPPRLIANNLRRMIADARAAGADVLLLGMKIPPNYGKAYTSAFEKVFADVAAETKVPLHPFFLEGVGGVPALMQSDGIHPNAKAQQRLLDNAWPVLKPLLK